jgi:hypothetical protein
MTGPVIEVATGLVDGVNTLFQTTNPYLTGSTRVFIDGLTTVAINADGWSEVPPSVIVLKEAPRVGDVVQVYYLAVPL